MEHAYSIIIKYMIYNYKQSGKKEYTTPLCTRAIAAQNRAFLQSYVIEEVEEEQMDWD